MEHVDSNMERAKKFKKKIGLKSGEFWAVEKAKKGGPQIATLAIGTIIDWVYSYSNTLWIGLNGQFQNFEIGEWGKWNEPYENIFEDFRWILEKLGHFWTRF